MKKYIYLSCMIFTAFLTTSSYAETKQTKASIDHCKINAIHTGVYQGFTCEGHDTVFTVHPSDTVTFDLVKELVNTNISASVFYEEVCKFKQKYPMAYDSDKTYADVSHCVKTLIVNRWKTIE
ncbi:MAG: hypothetical protein KDK51_02895 [Deltaproteobacteria bacterium]|nr:hypothetical protein [Deltaproteobacteria bacterium]